MILFFRAFFPIIISFLIFVGAEARTLLGNHHPEVGNYGRKAYITPSPPESSTPTKQEIVGRHDHRLLPAPSPKRDPIIGQLTSTSNDDDAELVILLPITVVGRKDHVPAPPAPKPEDRQGQIIITSSY